MRRLLNLSVRNMLLNALPRDDFALLAPHLEAVRLERRFALKQPQAKIEHVYFPNSGIASTVARADRDRRVEVGLFGRDGMSGAEVVMGDDFATHECFVHIAGDGLRLSTRALQEAMDLSPTLRPFLLRFSLVAHIQTEHTALANALAQLEDRLCRWLLMCHDRIDGDVIPLTHEFIALMLGVRRAGVTGAVHMLEGYGLIRTSRGSVTIRDREGLELRARGIYGKPEAEYQRLIGVSPREYREAGAAAATGQSPEDREAPGAV